MGELAVTMKQMEKKPASLRQLSDLVTKSKKDHPDVKFDEADVGRNNGYRVSPAWLYIQPGLNLREVDEEHAAVFKDMWKNGSRVPPILVKALLVDGVTRLKIVDGHHRYAGLMAAIAEGCNIVSVPVEEFTGNDVEETLEIIRSSQGKALKPIERAKGFARLRAWGVSVEDIASGSGNNVQTVRRALILAEAEENVKALVRDDRVSADVAINLIVECKGTERDVYKELMDSLDEAQRAGKGKVTARFVKSKKVSVKPKVIRETFTSLLPASSQIRAQIERVKTESVTDPESVTISVDPDVARNLLAVLEMYDMQKAQEEAEKQESDDAAAAAEENSEQPDTESDEVTH